MPHTLLKRFSISITDYNASIEPDVSMFLFENLLTVINRHTNGVNNATRNPPLLTKQSATAQDIAKVKEIVAHVLF